MATLYDFENFPKAVEFFKYAIRKGYTIDDILEHFEIDDYTLIELLIRYDEVQDVDALKAIREYYKKFTIPSDKVLLISDTHIGGKFEDYRLLLAAYEYAYKHGIKHVIHGGDMIQGLTHKENIKDELSMQISKYKYLHEVIAKDLDTYLLYGNHEYNLLLKDNFNLDKYTEELDNVTKIGVQNGVVFLNDDYPIDIYHEVPAIDDKVPDLDYAIKFCGHSHLYDNNGITFRMPALANTSYSITESAGFMELENVGDEYVTKCLKFKSNVEPYVHEEKRVPKKKQ